MVNARAQRCRRTIQVRVPIPARLSRTGRRRWAVKPIDACLAGLVRMLNALGAQTAGCCCGHGERAGEVLLADGTVIRLPVCGLEARP